MVLAIVCTAAAFILFGALIDAVGPVRATVITYINPAVAAVLGVLVLSETFTVPMASGSRWSSPARSWRRGRHEPKNWKRRRHPDHPSHHREPHTVFQASDRQDQRFLVLALDEVCDGAVRVHATPGS